MHDPYRVDMLCGGGVRGRRSRPGGRLLCPRLLLHEPCRLGAYAGLRRGYGRLRPGNRGSGVTVMGWPIDARTMAMIVACYGRSLTGLLPNAHGRDLAILDPSRAR